MANFLKSITGFFGGGTKSVIGVDIGYSSIKIVQLRKRKGRALLETYGELSLGPYAGVDVGRAASLPVEKLSEAVVDLMREANVTARDCGVAIPTASSLVSLIELPAIGEKELAEMIPMEARKYIPVPVSEVALDWWVIPQGDNMSPIPEEDGQQNKVRKGRMVDVLLVAILNETLTKYHDLVRLAGLRCSFFEVEIFSSIRASLEHNDIAPVMILDIGAAVTKLSIVERGLVRSSHTINRGAQDITIAVSKAMGVSGIEAEKRKRAYGIVKDAASPEIVEVGTTVLNYIFAEARKIIINFEKRYAKNVGRVVMTGGGATLKGILESARENFQTEAVLADPFSKIEAPAFLQDVLADAGPEFSVALGVALRKITED